MHAPSAHCSTWTNSKVCYLTPFPFPPILPHHPPTPLHLLCSCLRRNAMLSSNVSHAPLTRRLSCAATTLLQFPTPSHSSRRTAALLLLSLTLQECSFVAISLKKKMCCERSFAAINSELPVMQLAMVNSLNNHLSPALQRTDVLLALWDNLVLIKASGNLKSLCKSLIRGEKCNTFRVNFLREIGSNRIFIVPLIVCHNYNLGLKKLF